MKTITILSAILFISFSSTTDITFDKCMVNLSKEELLADQIELSCHGFADDERFTIEDFSVKFPGHPAEEIAGTGLSEQAKLYLEQMKPNQMIYLFQIKNVYLDGKRIQASEIPGFYIKLASDKPLALEEH